MQSSPNETSSNLLADSNALALHRSINWVGAFWVASGVAALVLFSMGAITATIGKPAWIVWIISISFGFIQAFTYAEIAGLFPHKSGGTSVYGAVAWINYSKLIPPLSIWCNWIAWAPVLAIGSGLSAGYILTTLFPADAVINTWQITLADLSRLKTGLTLRIDATFIVGATLMILVFAIQNGGILRSARATMILGISSLFPLLLLALVPIITGDIPLSNFFPLAPLAFDHAGHVIDGEWNKQGWILFAGGLFIAAWSTYAFETAVCYTREFKNPRRDTVRAILYSGLLCIVAFTVIPIAFQGYLGLGNLVEPAVLNAQGEVIIPAVYDGMLASDIYSGMGVANVFVSLFDGSSLLVNLVVVMLVMTFLLAIMTTLSGASRTLYQGSIDGLLPKYLSTVNERGAPTHAMWTNLLVNLVLLSMSDYVFLLAASNVSYIIFNFLNLNAGWIHRMDRPQWDRPYRAPTVLLILGTLLAFVNLVLMAMGANVWGAGTLVSGLTVAALIIPLFYWRHYVVDKGRYPISMLDDMKLGSGAKAEKRAGLLPYVTLLLGVITVCAIRYNIN